MDSASSLPGPQVHYTFNKVLMLQEPLLVVATFCILFFTVIVYVRLDFSITKVPRLPCVRLGHPPTRTPG